MIYPVKNHLSFQEYFLQFFRDAGQVYNEDYWIAGVFVVIEAALITTAVVYDNKGDDQTEYFESYADDYTNPDHNWSVVRYAEWLVEYEYNNDQEFLNRIVISDDAIITTVGKSKLG